MKLSLVSLGLVTAVALTMTACSLTNDTSTTSTKEPTPPEPTTEQTTTPESETEQTTTPESETEQTTTPEPETEQTTTPEPECDAEHTVADLSKIPNLEGVEDKYVYLRTLVKDPSQPDTEKLGPPVKVQDQPVELRPGDSVKVYSQVKHTDTTGGVTTVLVKTCEPDEGYVDIRALQDFDPN